MSDAEKITNVCKEAFRAPWRDPQRRLILARAIVHRRQFENWWKVELATHMWELADKYVDCYVFMESHDRADVTLGCAKQDAGPVRLDPTRAPCVPMELKSIATWWKSPLGGLCDSSKKCLEADMDDAWNGRRSSNPISVVALMITHHPRKVPEGPKQKKAEDREQKAAKAYNQIRKAARQLAKSSGRKLKLVLDEEIVLPNPGFDELTPLARQMVWIVRSDPRKADRPQT